MGLMMSSSISAVMVVVDGKPVRLQLCDMAGQVRIYNFIISVTTNVTYVTTG